MLHLRVRDPRVAKPIAHCPQILLPDEGALPVGCFADELEPVWEPVNKAGSNLGHGLPERVVDRQEDNVTISLRC